jgi:hypothetical protein
VKQPITSGFLALLSAVAGGQVPVINEIHYEPADKNSHEEFVELYNPGPAVCDLAGWRFAAGIEFIFPEGTFMAPGDYLVIAEDPEALTRSFGSSIPVLGPFGGQLGNEGERVVLADRGGNVADEVDYRIGFPWPLASAGDGSSIELVNPSLENDLGGSWRASGTATGDRPRRYFLEATDANWHYRKGRSNPPANWREVDFVEDGSWLVGQTGIGYDDGDDITILDDMKGNYTTIYARHTFTIASAADIPLRLKVGIYVDDGAVVWINGSEVARLHVKDGDLNYDAVASSHDAAWEDAAVPNPSALLRAGTNVIAVHALNASLPSSDFSFDATVFVPADNEDAMGLPTPGGPNSVYAENAPPQIGPVAHRITQPSDAEDSAVTASVTDFDGIRSVTLLYQIVSPGSYIPACLPVPLATLLARPETSRPANPAFEDPANWTSVPMVDDGTGGDAAAGDGVYTATVPRQPNRTLVRYRIAATDGRGASVRVPYADDPSLNFAYFVYNGVPDYAVQTSITGRPTVHPAAALTAMPVYFLITRNQDLTQCIAATTAEQIPQGYEARFSFNWEGTWVYEGEVYDHIVYRLRGANGRYQVPPDNPANCAGKRHWHFKFHKSRYLKARDKWGNLLPTAWSDLNTCRMFGNRLDGNWGLGDHVNDIIWNAYGVPAPSGFYFHWRVIDGAEEAPGGANGQYLGDFWGIARAFENYDGRFLDAHRIEKGNLYKLVNQTNVGLDQIRYHAPGAVDDGSDHNNIEYNLRPTQPDSWLDAYVDYEEWYRYHAICQALRHYDYWPEANKNAAWYFAPPYLPENGSFGKMNTFPFDADATWGPTWNNGWDRPYDAIYGSPGKPEYQKQYRNHVREVRDLLWQRDQLEPLIRQAASFIDPLEEADIDRWRNAPAEAGRQYFSATNQKNLEGKIADMLAFAFTGGSWPGGDVGAGGRAKFLDDLADGPDRTALPGTPTAAYTGEPGYPVDALTFRAGAFSDPQGAGTFKAMEWRMAAVTPVLNAGTIPLADPRWKEMGPVQLELAAVWKSGEIASFVPDVAIPIRAACAGTTYRVRVRMCDTTNLWSHWSAPVEFTAGPPSRPIPELDDLRITEIMYRPLGGGGDEFVELQNKGTRTLDLGNVWFREGIEFDFQDSAVTRLGPGEIIVLVGNRAAFVERHPSPLITIAGEYSRRLDGSGERIVLTYGGNLDILDFTYSPGWYPETDGQGLSLNIADVALESGPAWSEKASWFPSSVLHGTPGLPDADGPDGTRLRPGDVTLDGRLDVSDAVAFIRLLLSGTAIPLPCGGESLASEANRAMLDFNDDTRVNLADTIYFLGYLFMNGPAHVRGTVCVHLEGCPEACK